MLKQAAVRVSELALACFVVSGAEFIRRTRSAWRSWRLWSRRGAGGEQRWPVARQARVATGMAVACCYAAQGVARPGLRRWQSPGFVAGLFAAGRVDASRVVDAGAGIGALSNAFVPRWPAGGLGCRRATVDVYESHLHLGLTSTEF